MTAPISSLPSAEIIELFSRDPVSWTTEERAKIIEEIRNARGQFNAARAAKAMKPKKEKAAPKEKRKYTLADLGDLKL